jgi:hypothetical protein
MRFKGLSLVVLCSMIGAASADDKTEEQKRADQLFEEGRNLLAAGDQNAGAACEKFNDAIKLDPEAPGTMLNLGLCNEKLSKFKTALYWFRRAQARAAETNLPDYETAAKQHTVDLAGKVATIKIQFTGTPPADTKVKIDNQEIAPADYLNAEVDPGAHTLVAGAPGHKNVTQDFNVEGRGGNTLNIELVAGDNSVVVDPGARRRKTAIIIAAGGGALLIASGILSGVIAKGRYDECVEDGELDLNRTKCFPNTMTMNNDAKAAKYANDQRDLAKYWGTGLFIGGIAAIGVASALYFTAPEKERIDRTVFTPSVSKDQVGFAFSGAF